MSRADPNCIGDDFGSVVPSPNTPLVPVPHPHSVPSVLIAKTFCWPLAIKLQFDKAPTCTGDDRCVVSPNPSTPLELYPQDHNVPSVLIAIENILPQDIFSQSNKAPICTGEEKMFKLLVPN